jgi:hypothetical protein
LTCGTYIRRYWKGLLARWAVFAILGFVAGYFAGWDLRTAWPVILIGSGILNLGWTLVA